MLDLNRFSELRTHLFHLTSRANRDCIVSEGSLHSAATIFQRANRPDLLATRRLHHVTVPVCQAEVHVRDQAPLHAGAISFEPGWDLARWVRHVNNHVFFWPGSTSGPIPSGINHHTRYRSEEPVLLRIRTSALLLSGATPKPRFSRVNSGAIEAETRNLGLTTGRVKNEISLLREYRTRLIADGVTGKVDVRGAATELLAEGEGPELSDEDDAVADPDSDMTDDTDAASDEAEA